MSAASTDTSIRTGRVTRTALYLVLLLFALFYLLPFAIMVINSMKPLAEITGGNMMALPQDWSFEPWAKAWSTAQIGVEPTGLKPYFWNSIKMVVPAVLISTMLGALNGYVLTKWRFKFDTVIFGFLLFACFIPFQIVLIPMARILGPVGLYAGAGRSRLYQKGDSVNIERETLKRMVAEHQLEIMVATDAACEGLNLQTLGTLMNIDLPWNPTRLEQRIGRIKRFGQVREKVDMLNLVNEQTVDEKVYDKLSERMQDRYNLFGSLPDTIKDEWIEDIETMGDKMDEYIDAQKTANGFDLRYTSTMEPTEKDWRDCSDVLSRRDFSELMMSGWSETK